MAEQDQLSNQAPLFSFIVAVYNDWKMLDGCLRSLAEDQGPAFEVIVVDDGSRESAPEYIRRWSSSYPLTIVKENHGGISRARNKGICLSKGSLLVFVDADSRIQKGCLAALASVVAESSQHNFFQLRLVGDPSTLLGRAEGLRLLTFQQYVLQPNGGIRYLNTAGFAVRRAKVDAEVGLFDPVALRGEDTLLLADLILRGELPLFVKNASVQHAVLLSSIGCLRKDVRSAYLERTTYDMIASKGVRIRMSNRERLKMLRLMWTASQEKTIGRSAWFALVARQSLQRVVSVIYGSFRIGSRFHRAPRQPQQVRL
jgi:glycosyltransferase involved in cell wall biosynthesis